MEKKWQFDRPWTQQFTKVRQIFIGEFLGNVSRQIGLETALDVGCAVGDFSKFLLDLGFRVVGVDGREENAAEGKRRYPEVTFLASDAENLPLAEIGTFDLVLCVGLLYHLENPFRAIRNLHCLTDKVLVVESMCAPGSEPAMELLDEYPAEDQGLNYVAFYPTESCLVKMLYRAGFPFVYGFTSLPEHELFHATRWQKKQRTMLVAAKVQLIATGLESLPEPTRPWDIWSFPIAPWRLRLGRLANIVRKLAPQAPPDKNVRKA